MVTGQDTLTVEWTVEALEVYQGRRASRIESSQGDFYYSVDSDALLEFVSRSVFSFGEELILEARWRKRVEQPLNLGNRWEDTFSNRVVNQGVAYSIESGLSGVVEAIEDVLTPVDFFEECYRVRLDIHSTITHPSGDREEEELHLTEWYAPGVGMVKREVGGGERLELTDYRVF